jgi:hypothetical protein
MSLSANKIILANAATNTAGAYFEPQAVIATNTSNVGTVVPAGLYQALPTANVVIQFNTSTNIAAPTWTTVIAANTAGIVWSDGTNVQALSTTGNVTITLYGSNGGQAVSGTFNNV